MRTQWCVCAFCDLGVKGLFSSGTKEPRNGQQAVIFTGCESATSALTSYRIIITPALSRVAMLKAIGNLPSRLLFLLPSAALLAHFPAKMLAIRYGLYLHSALIYGMDNNPTNITLHWTVELLSLLAVLCGGAGVPEGFPCGSFAVTIQIYHSKSNQGDEWGHPAAKTTRAEAHYLFFTSHPSSCSSHTCYIIRISPFVYS